MRALVWMLAMTLVGCAHTATGGTVDQGEFGGRKRTWVRFDPTGPRESKRALVVALHGHGGNGEGMRRLSGMDTLAQRHGFSVLYPDGLDKRWRDGRLPPDGVDDVAFLVDLIQGQVQTGNFDPARVYLTGMSNGAFMTHTLLCSHAKLFAAAAPVAGGLSPQLLARCKPARPVPMLVVNNTEDGMVPYAGGRVARKDGKNGEVLATVDTVLAWQRFNGCRVGAADGDATSVAILAARDDDTRAVMLTFDAGCPAAPVVLARIESGGHTWPGGWGYLPKMLIGKTSRAWDASAGMWDFFEGRRTHLQGSPGG